MSDEIEFDNLKEKSIKSVKWAYSSIMLPLIISPVMTVVVAALLGPRVYGIVAIASLMVSLVDIVKDHALMRAFIQSEGDERSLFNQVFWLSLGYGIVFYVAVFIGAPLIADLFHSKESIVVIRVLGLQIILSSLCTAQNGIVVRMIDFKKRFKIDVLPNLTLLCVAIPLAFSSMGVWALVIGYLSSSLVRAIVVWCLVPVRPRLELDVADLKKMALFGFFCSAEALLAWFFMWGDRIIVGHFLDVKLLGIYTLASMVVGMAFTVMLAPVTSMSYPVFCRIKDDKTQFLETIYRLLQMVGLLTFPMGVLMAVAAGIFSAILGEKWTGIATPLGILALADSLIWTVNSITSDSVRAQGRADIMPKVQVARLVYTVPILIAGVKMGGLNGFCYAKLITASTSFLFFVALLKIVVKVELTEVRNRLRSSFLSALIMAVCVFLGWNLLKVSGLSGIGGTVILVVGGAFIYIGSICVFDPLLLRNLWRNIIRAF
jgi:teichuronic acid exporter